MRLSEFNIDACKTIILQIGGNNVDNGVDLDTFSENYVTLLNSISEDNRRIIVSGLLPRISVNLKPYNNTLKEICVKNQVEFIDNSDCFLLASGEMPSSFSHYDKLHLNVYGSRRLFLGINKVFLLRSTLPVLTH